MELAFGMEIAMGYLPLINGTCYREERAIDSIDTNIRSSKFYRH